MATIQESKERYRQVALLLADAARKKQYQSVLISSSVAGEGSSTAAVNVARQLVDVCRLRTLLIEFDQPRPRFLELYDLDGTKTLDAFSSGAASLRECIQETASGVHVIPSDESSTSVDALVLKRILDDVAEDYDVIVVDAPPILERAGAIAAGSFIPRLILVVEAGRVRQEMLERTKNQLSSAKIEIVGAILNKHKRYIPKWVYRWLS